MKLKKSVTAVAMTLSLYSSVALSGGVPVFDAIAEATSQTQWFEKLSQWQNTVSHYKNQMDAYKNQLATATGVRDVQSFMSQASNLTNDLKRLQSRGISLNDLLTNPGGNYSSELNSLYSKYKIFDNCANNATGDYLNSCKQMVLNQAVAVEDTDQVQSMISSTLKDISNLSGRIALSDDSKESQDLSNVVAAKSVQLNALTTQWEMTVKQSELRNNLLMAQRQKAHQQQQLNAAVTDFNKLGN